jgi:DNA-binding MarR family transcriptional regulator
MEDLQEDLALVHLTNRLYRERFGDAIISLMAKSNHPGPGPRRRSGGGAFLLAQLGAHAARRFAERIAPIPLALPEAGILRKISSDEGISQQALAEHLGLMPSRMVQLIDDLEGRGIVDRRRSSEDRRNYALVLTERGREIFKQLSRLAAEHEEQLLAGLTQAERAQLIDLCQRIADEQGLTPGVHPGYRDGCDNSRAPRGRGPDR